jgi:glycosyltransferase involved in cell wall biosynthesis
MKQYCVISCPIDTYSGYGSRARDLVRAIHELKKDDWEIQIISQRWGNTPWGYINDHLDTWGFIKPLINTSGQITRQPDVWMQLTVPNEFQPIGKYNIGFTAGIETTICDPSWIEGVNRMNLTLVSSNHAKQVFQTSAFEQKDDKGNTTKKIFLEKPVEVLFEGVDLNKYFEIANDDLEETDLVLELDTIKEEFCYLFVGHWLQGEFGHDRKNIGETIQLFLETFKDKKSKPALILKTSAVGSSIMDRDSILEKIESIKSFVNSKDLPNIYLLHGEMEDFDMNNLYNHPKVKAMVYFGHGEGFGRPLLEFSVCKKPIIASNWSGHKDFLLEEFTALVGGQVKPLHPSSVVANMLIQESQWFYADTKSCQVFMKDMYENYSKYLDNSKRQAHKNKREFSMEKMKEVINTYLDLIPKQQALKLPQLKKIQLPTLKAL